MDETLARSVWKLCGMSIKSLEEFILRGEKKGMG